MRILVIESVTVPIGYALNKQESYKSLSWMSDNRDLFEPS